MKSKEFVSDKDFDKVFHDKLYSFEMEPSEAVWEGIASQLSTNKTKRVLPLLWMAAASLAAIVGVAVWFSSQKEPVKLTGTAGSEIVIPKQELVKAPAQKEIIAENQISGIAAPEAREDQTKNVAKLEDQLEINAKAQVKTASIAPTKVSENIVVIKTEIAEKPQIAAENSIVSNEPQALMIAASQPDKEQATEIEGPEVQRKQRSIKSIGSLVNFVVGKVDKRKNKIIEFEDGDEGTTVSSLNLGLLKFQAKQ